jgi:hypothetical protein
MEPRPETQDEDVTEAPAPGASEPIMEAPGAASDASARAATASWNPAQGDRSFGYGTGSGSMDASDPTSDTTDSETEDADGEAGR